MPLHGIDHVELYVGNAAQAAYFFTHALGFRETAYAGLETGIARPRPRTCSSRAASGSCSPARCSAPARSPPRRRATATASRSIALSRPRRRARLPLRGRSTAPAGVREPWEATDEHGTRPDGDDRHLRRHPAHVRRARRLRRRRSCPATSAASAGRRTPGMFAGIDHIVGNVELGRMDEWVGYYERRLRDDRDDPLLRRGHLDRVLGADVEGDGRRQRPGQVPDQRAGRGQAQVADRGVPRVLRRPGRPAHRARDARHRRHRRASCSERGVRFLDDPGELLRGAARRGSARSTRTSRTCASSASSSTATTRATCCRSSPSRSATGRRCSSRSSSATARAASARATSRRCSRRSSASRTRGTGGDQR